MDSPPEPSNQSPEQSVASSQRNTAAVNQSAAQVESNANESTFDAFTSEHKKGLIFLASIFIVLFCLLGLLSPDGRTFEKEFRNDMKNGTQLKDVVAYFKERDLTWTWNRTNRELTVLLPGRNWIPFVKVDYKENVFFDNFNRLKGRSGSMEYKFFR